MLLYFNREYVVDLVGEPGNIHGPDSSINGAYVSSIPSPFQISHLKECQSPYVDVAACSQSLGNTYLGVLCFIYTWKFGLPIVLNYSYFKLRIYVALNFDIFLVTQLHIISILFIMELK